MKQDIQTASLFSTKSTHRRRALRQRLRGVESLEPRWLMAVSLGDYVWNDSNFDGIQNEGASEGVNGVEVSLYTSAGTQVGTAIQTANDSGGNPGYYSFNDIDPGDYYVLFAAPLGKAFTMALQGGVPNADSNADRNGKSSTFTLTAGVPDLSIDAGLVPTASVGTFVWWDENADGLQVDVEGGIEGATVRLLQNGVQVAVEITDEFGQYFFENLAPGTYAIQFDRPVGFDVASPPDVPSPVPGRNDKDDSDGLGPNIITADFTLTPGQINLDIDQGFYKAGKIGNYVWRDVNNNGVQDETPDFGINGVTVTLFTGAGAQVGSPILTANDGSGNPGFYRFDGLTAGQYYVQFTIPAGQVFTTSTVGDPTKDSNAGPSGQTATFSLPSGFEDLSIDAGLRPIDLSLIAFVTDTTPPINSTVTYSLTVNNPIGFSAATGVTVSDVLPPGLAYVSDNAGGGYNSATRSWTVGTIAPGDSVLLQVVATITSSGIKTNVAQVQTADQPDFDSSPGNALGVHEDDDAIISVTPSANIGNYVWRDLNNDGIQNEAATYGINGVTVTLFTSSRTPMGSPVVTTNDVGGNPGYYLFSDIDPGNYYVVVTAPTGQVFTTQFAGLPGTSTTDSNVNSAGRSNTFTLQSGIDNLSIDAGVRPIDLSLSKTVSDPTPRVGTNVTYTVMVTNESGFSLASGVTVQDLLPTGMTYVSDNGGGSYNSGTGMWTIGMIAPGDIASLQVVATVANGGIKTNTAQVQTASQPDFDSIPGNAPGVHEDDDVTISVIPSANIGNYVWRDLNNDGIQNEAATYGINGVTVTLFTSTGTPVGSPVATANDVGGNPGYYLFSDIDPGNYYVVVTAPTGQVFTNPFAGTAVPATDSNVDASGKSNTFTLGSGVDELTIDAGFKSSQICTLLDFNGNTSTSGTLGNIRTFASGSIAVNASGFSRDKASGAWGSAYLGSYGGGLGVTDSSEGAGANDTHTVDNMDGRDNYILFEFNQAVVLDSAFLGYVVADSDLTVWIGTIPNAFNSHQALSDALLAGLFMETNLTTLTTTRLADLNANEILGNIIVIAADVSDTTPEDRFKLAQLTVCSPGSQQPASLGDFVWHDLNGNGVQDLGEPGISGASVTLTGGGPDGVINGVGDTVLATTTSSNGAYAFTNLSPGTQYRVAFGLPAGYTAASPRKQGTDASLDSDGLTSDIVILSSGQNNTTLDAGFYKDVKIGNFVWNDLDKDGFQDSTELGIGGVALSLTGTSGSGATINLSTSTAADGSYLFSALPPGTYQVSVSASSFVSGGVLAGYTASPTLVDTNRALDSNTNPSATSPAILGSGSTDLTVDFGYYLDSTNVCVNLYLEGNTSTSGAAGNILTFSSGSISAKASAFSRDSAGTWATAYLGRYGGGLGVTDASEGNGSNNSHTVDNIGRNNYVLFEFSQGVTIDTAYLGYVVGDSDIKVWIGTASNAFNNHYLLSDAFLTGLGFSEVNLGSGSTRTADINASNLSGNILVISANTGEATPNDQFKIAELSLCATIPIANSGTKFFSVDDDSNKTFKYGSTGNFTQDFPIAAKDARGITSNVSGSNVWIANKDGKIYNYTSAGVNVSKWSSKISGLQGVTTNGTHIWTVSDTTDRVYYYRNGTTYADGSSMNPTSSFALNTYNNNPTDLTTDGAFIWVVNEGNVAGGVGDMVFKYSLTGTYLGRWQLDAANARPTGITVDPAGGNKIWIVDNSTLRIYEYSGATGCISGGLIASKSYALAVGNTNPQGIADPPGPSDEAIAQESSLAVNEQYINRDVNPFFNTFNATDVNSDGVTSPLDALLVINRLNAMRSGQSLESEAWIYDDVSNDGALSPLDALLVINQLSSGRQATPLLENGLSGNAGLAAGSVDPGLPELGGGEGEGIASTDAYFANYYEQTQSFAASSEGEQFFTAANKGLRNIKRNFRQG